MAKKKFIISESAVRRFQKLASLKPLSEMGMPPAYNRDAEEMYEEEEEEVVGVVEPGMGEPGMDEPPMDEPPMDEPAGGEGAEEMARNVIMAVADALGVEIDIDGGDEEGMDEPPMEEPPMEEPPMEEPPMEMDDEDEMMQEGNAGNTARKDVANTVPAGSRYLKEEELEEEVEMIDEEELTEAVMKRVISRLKKMTTKRKKA